MAQRADQYDERRELLDLALTKVAEDRYPSATMMDIVEYLMGPDERPICLGRAGRGSLWLSDIGVPKPRTSLHAAEPVRAGRRSRPDADRVWKTAPGATAQPPGAVPRLPNGEAGPSACSVLA